MFEKLKKITPQIIMSQLIYPRGYTSLPESQYKTMQELFEDEEFKNKLTLIPAFAKRYFEKNPIGNFYIGRNPYEALVLVKTNIKDLDIKDTMFDIIKIYKSVINDKQVIAFKNRCGDAIYEAIKEPKKVNKEFDLKKMPMHRIHEKLYALGITLEIEREKMKEEKELFTEYQAAYILKKSPRTLTIIRTNTNTELFKITEQDKENFISDKVHKIQYFTEEGIRIINNCFTEENQMQEEELNQSLEKFKKEKIYGIAELARLKDLNHERLKKRAEQLKKENDKAIVDEPFMSKNLGVKEAYIDMLVEMTLNNKPRPIKKEITETFKETQKEFTIKDAYKKIIEASPTFAEADIENNIGYHYAEITRQYYGLDFDRPFKFNDLDFVFKNENGKTYLTYNGDKKNIGDLNLNLNIILNGLQPKDIIPSKFCPKPGQEYYTYNFFEKKIIKKIKGEDELFDAMTEKIGLIFSEHEIKNLSEEDIINHIKTN